jgi:hypothetical protein
MAGACAVAVPVATPAAPPRGGAGPSSNLAPRGSSFSRRVNCRRDSPRVVAPTRSRVVTRLAGRDPGEAGTDAGVGQILKVGACVLLHSLVSNQCILVSIESECLIEGRILRDWPRHVSSS